LERKKYEAATRIIDSASGERFWVVKRSRLEILAGPDKGLSLELGAEPISAGKGTACQLRLSDESVSSHHFSICPTEDGFLLRDEGSTNGTFLNGLRVQAAYLAAASIIEVGETQLSFSMEGEDLRLPLSRKTRFGRLLGHSDVMRALFALLSRVSKSESTVLIEGESGTGKELAAQAIHEKSSRDGQSFVAVDCGAIPQSLIESELFGHIRGAFTGAGDDRVGLIERADGGTLFLDEIGELPLELQPRLLRVLESKTIRRVGENEEKAVDVRVLAATNRNLQVEVEEGRFRQDLYYRLSVVKVRMPSLRARREEVPRLIAHFLAEFGRDPAQPLPESIMAALRNHDWPGNVRELRNAVERLAVVPGMNASYYISGESEAALAPSTDHSDALPLDLPFHQGKQQWVENYERRYLAQMLERCGGNISELARASGLSRQSCHRLLKRHALI
jgi:DNA-binding NtrC family response regulator